MKGFRVQGWAFAVSGVRFEGEASGHKVYWGLGHGSCSGLPDSHLFKGLGFRYQDP